MPGRERQSNTISDYRKDFAASPRRRGDCLASLPGLAHFRIARWLGARREAAQPALAVGDVRLARRAERRGEGPGDDPLNADRPNPIATVRERGEATRRRRRDQMGKYAAVAVSLPPAESHFFNDDKRLAESAVDLMEASFFRGLTLSMVFDRRRRRAERAPLTGSKPRKVMLPRGRRLGVWRRGPERFRLRKSGADCGSGNCAIDMASS